MGVEEWEKTYKELEPTGKKSILFIMTDDTKNCDDVAEFLEKNYSQLKGAVLTIHTNRSGEISETVSGKKEKELQDLRNKANEIDSLESPYKVIVSVMMLKEGWDVKNVTTIVGLRPGVAPLGYLNEKRSDRKCHVVIDPERAPIVKQMFEKVANEHWSGRKIYHWLKFELNFKSKGNHNVSLSNIFLILQTHFYYGVFEYPEKSGNWYTGKHEPIITKELFDRAQSQLKRDQIVRSELKEFAFTKLITCGLCGSGVTADEKFKKRKDGSTIKYVYYGCTRSRDIHCKCGYIREEDLIDQLVKLIDKLDLNEMHMKQKFEEEVTRLNKFQQSFLGTKTVDKTKIKQIDLKDYARYVLREGTAVEKREFLSCIKNRLILKNKIVSLELE